MIFVLKDFRVLKSSHSHLKKKRGTMNCPIMAQTEREKELKGAEKH